jgi:hypothetical protein
MTTPLASCHDEGGRLYELDCDDEGDDLVLNVGPDGIVDVIPLADAAEWLVGPLIRSLIIHTEEQPQTEAVRSRAAMLEAACNLVRRALDLEADPSPRAALRCVPPVRGPLWTAGSDQPPEEPF